MKEPLPVAVELVQVLRDCGQTVAFAESLTAGLAAASVADVPGASAVLRGGVVSYATDVKRDLLGVDVAVLDSVGPVSKQCAEQMAASVRALLGADWGVSLTGVAGPDTQDRHAVGEVWIGLADPHGYAVALRAYPKRHHRWILVPGEETPVAVVDGDRNTSRAASVEAALDELLTLVNLMNEDETGGHDA